MALLHAVFNTVGDTEFASEFVPRSAATWLAPAAIAVLGVLAMVPTRGHLAYEPWPGSTSGVWRQYNRTRRENFPG